jgi:purine nucleosidase
MEKVAVLFDTDIGSDIDDAVALAYLLARPECELLGITTVTGEPVERARLADAVLRAAGRADVPIHAGIERPFLIQQRQPRADQKTSLARWEHRTEFATNTAVPFLRETIRSRPGEITLLAVGPFTNVGALFASDPEIPGLLKRLVIMGGAYTMRWPGRDMEWNISLDPHAAAVMFHAPVPETIAYGLEVTLPLRLPAEECRRRFRGGALDVVADMAEVWFREQPHITFHDPLAAVSLFEPDVCELQRGCADVELISPRLTGMTHWTPDESGPHRIGVKSDPERFFERYFHCFQ